MDRFVDAIAGQSVRVTRHARTFLVACLVVIGWALTGPLFQYSDGWQLSINTGTTIVTFLLGFLTQHALSLAGADHRDRIEAKLDELLEQQDVR